MKAQKLISALICFLLLLSASAQPTVTKTPDRRKDVRAPIDTSWGQLSAGDKMFSNSELFSPAGQTLDLAKGTRVLNLELALQKKFVVVKQNKGIAVIDADSFKLISQSVYEKGEAGSMYGLAVDGNDSTVYFTGAKKIDLSVGNKTTTPLGIGLCDNNIVFVALAIPNEVAVVDIAEGKVVSNIPVGVCPYTVIISKDKRFAFVSNFGGTSSTSYTVTANVQTNLYQVFRTINFDSKEIFNDKMRVFDKEQHLGTSLFLNQVAYARQLGFIRLSTTALEWDGIERWDGYYRWARLGYKMTDRNDLEDFDDLKRYFNSPVANLTEMVLSDDGYAFWIREGFTWVGEFLLADDSPSMRHLRRYLTMKKIDFTL